MNTSSTPVSSINPASYNSDPSKYSAFDTGGLSNQRFIAQGNQSSGDL